MTSRVRIGTRGSALALVQAALVAAELEARSRAPRLVLVETEGDRRPPDTVWGEGAFVTAIEEALLARRADIAVHSAKDLPTHEDPRLRIVAYLPRADPRDALVVRGGAHRRLADLPAGSIIGTDSPRRAGFLRHARPDLIVRPLHGNVDTRLRRLDAGDVDALILAVAGLERLGCADRIAERLDPATLPPAPGQGAIAVQARADDLELAALAAAFDHAPTRLAVLAERSFLQALGGGCRSPVAALGDVADGRLRLTGSMTDPHGHDVLVESIEASPDCAVEAGAELARRISIAGADARARAAADSGPRPVVLVTRPAVQAAPLVAALAGSGIESVVIPALEVRPITPSDALDRSIASVAPGDWVAVTSANGARAALDAFDRCGLDPLRVSWAAVGDATAAVLAGAGIGDLWQPEDADGLGLAADVPIRSGARVIWPHGSLADTRLAAVLRARGAEVVAVLAYRTEIAPRASVPLLRAALAVDRPPDAVLFSSGSAVDGFLALASGSLRAQVVALPAICIGPKTAGVARAAGFHVLGVSSSRSSAALADLTRRLLRDRNPGVNA